jgi:hypothetical protein
MFLAIVFIALGLFLLLDAVGLIAGVQFWGLFWAVVFLGMGIKLLAKKNSCPMCGMHNWEGKMHSKINEKMHGHCCDHHGHNHDHDEDGQDHH